jgi:hypothetical protein
MVFGHSGRPADGPVCMCVIDSATWFSRWIESSNLGTLWQTFWWGSARGNFDLLCTWWTFGETGTGVGQFNGVSGLWVDSGHCLYAADTNYKRVQLFDLGCPAG